MHPRCIFVDEDVTDGDATDEDATNQDVTDKDATDEDATDEDATDEDATYEDAKIMSMEVEGIPPNGHWTDTMTGFCEPEPYQLQHIFAHKTINKNIVRGKMDPSGCCLFYL